MIEQLVIVCSLGALLLCAVIYMTLLIAYQWWQERFERRIEAKRRRMRS